MFPPDTRSRTGRDSSLENNITRLSRRTLEPPLRTEVCPACVCNCPKCSNLDDTTKTLKSFATYDKNASGPVLKPGYIVGPGYGANVPSTGGSPAAAFDPVAWQRVSYAGLHKGGLVNASMNGAFVVGQRAESHGFVCQRDYEGRFSKLWYGLKTTFFCLQTSVRGLLMPRRFRLLFTIRRRKLLRVVLSNLNRSSGSLHFWFPKPQVRV